MLLFELKVDLISTDSVIHLARECPLSPQNIQIRHGMTSHCNLLNVQSVPQPSARAERLQVQKDDDMVRSRL